MRLPVAAIVVCAAFGPPAFAADWEVCFVSLDTVRRRAVEAEDAVRTAGAAVVAVDAAGADLKTCQVYRGLADRFDSCKYNVSVLKAAEDKHGVAVREAESQLARLKRAIAEVQEACELEPAPVATGIDSPADDRCRPAQELLQKDRNEVVSLYCQTLMSPADCQVCLAEP